MASELYNTIDALSREKGIDPQVVVSAIEDAIVVATRKYYKTQENLRAELDKDTGKIIWEKELEGNPEGIPAVYQAGGRQYVVFYASAGPGPGPNSIAYKAATPGAQGFYVFALAK